MKLMLAAPVLLALFCLTACDAKYSQHSTSGSGGIMAGNDQAAFEPVPEEMAAADAAPSEPAPAAPSYASPQLAYDYDYILITPANTLDGLVKNHLDACTQAGTQACQMVSSATSNDGDGEQGSRMLELRVTPQWLKTFEGGLSAGLAKAHGRIAYKSVTSEDLSLQIIDTDAHLKNKLALRDRLVQIIKSGNGKIADLVEAETQLSQVQGDIDAAQSSLAAMKKRVATIHLKLAYHSEGAMASRSAFAPVSEAFQNIFSNIMQTIAMIINLLSFNLPLILLAIPAFWFGRKWWLKRRQIKIAKTETPPPSE